MASIQEKQIQRRWYVDEWSTREKLCLASAVLRSGDQNWNAVSRTIKPNADINRPPDWMVPKACAKQYQLLLDSVETPKRKKRVAGEKLVESSETAAEYLVRILTQKHQEDLKRTMDSHKKSYYKLKAEIEAIESGHLTEEDLDKLIAEMDREDENKRLKELEHDRFLIEREQKKRDYERPLWKSPSVAAAQAAALKSSLAEKANESGSNSGTPETKPSSTPTSPLLTSLLQTPSKHQRSSVLSGATPTISNLLISSPAPPYSTDAPTLTKLLESGTSPRSTSSSLIDSSIDLHSKQAISPSALMNSQSIDSSSPLNTSPRLNKSPIRRTPPRSETLTSPLRVDSNPDISNVVRCLYMEDVDKKACVGIETTQLLLNQANVDLSKVDEQKLQDEIVEMIVEQQGTDGMNIGNLSQPTVSSAAVSSPRGLPTVVKMEVPETDSSLQMSLASKVDDSSVVVLDCDLTRSAMDDSLVSRSGDENTREIKIESDIPVEIVGTRTVSSSRSVVLQSQPSSQIVPTVIDVQTTHSLSLSQAEISVVGISPIKTEPIEPSPEDTNTMTLEDAPSHSEQPTTVIAGATSESNKSPEEEIVSVICGEDSSPSHKETPIKIGRVDSNKDISSGNNIGIDRINYGENVIILDTNLELSATGMSNDIIIDNDTEVIIAKDDSLKSGVKSDDDQLESGIVIKEEADDSDSMFQFNKFKSEDAQPSFEGELGTEEVKEIVLGRDLSPVEESTKTDSKKVSKLDSTKRLNKLSGEKPESESKRTAINVSERKGVKTASDKKESVKKAIVDDEDEVTDEGDDEDDSDEQLLSSLKRSTSSSDKKSSSARQKSTATPINIPAVSDFVDTSSDTHSTGGDDSESTTTSISVAPRLSKKTGFREKRDSVTSTTSSSSHPNTHEETDLRKWRKAVMLVFGRIASHKNSSIFLKPITDDQAPGYSEKIKQYIDLPTIKRNIENGTLRTTLDFQKAVMLMFTNALFYNHSSSDVYKEAYEMMMDTLEHIQLLVQTRGEGMPYAPQFGTETPEKQARTERGKRSIVTPSTPSTLTPLGTKRKRSGMEISPMTGNTDQSSTPVVKRRR